MQKLTRFDILALKAMLEEGQAAQAIIVEIRTGWAV